MTKGPWAWAILWAAIGNPRLASFLLPGFASATGQVELAISLALASIPQRVAGKEIRMAVDKLAE
ncbi:hypothetical protein [Sulfobacillus thermosulfidooxidans]|uniref:hypothetical protein n=1 Tax=Sulfobacillus thermosulfidooxidans TaxID=28034 RepID=UPI00096B97A4|nr:hypothetical protein [Sulfobacillus thermosulfidooxidans]OLZ12001.1 hypothetical protein BFX05_05885 [Sulfobacillus thermosulfidooxidans]OLZ16747.1 hypothetical protein BFX06_14710 [Sulfobacillus thermosulfidooxidans]OLZ20704.1 hypothetical protein BFX07_14570 [Sulfobacillus thermosulfidooxidans]